MWLKFGVAPGGELAGIDDVAEKLTLRAFTAAADSQQKRVR
jgi:hypothetical protein